MLFSAIIAVLGVNPYVTPPTEVLEFLFTQGKKTTSPIPVKGKLNGVWFEQSLVRYQGQWRLYINGKMAKAAKLPFRGSVVNIVGQTVEIELRINRNPPIYKMIPELKTELAKNAPAKKAFANLAAGRQKEVLRYLDSLKSPEARQRNVARVISHLLGQETDALHALMHRKKGSVSRTK